MSSSPSLPALPLEVLDSIVTFIRRPKHLIYLALTHSVLYRIIVPRHLYRRIIDWIHRRNVWNRVKEDPDRGRSVRYLTICSPPGPEAIGHPTLSDPLGACLMEAIRGMPQLKSLAIYSPFFQIDSRTKAFDAAFWEMVGQVCLGLEELYYQGGWSCLHCRDAIFSNSANQWSVGEFIRRYTAIMNSFYCWNSFGLCPI